MDKPVVTQKGPTAITVEAGKTYLYCAFGRSQKQPFCEGSHSGTSFSPTLYKSEQSKTVYFCACRASKKGVQCDGSHNSI